MDAMEHAIPYKLSSDQAVLFYVQAAVMVACTICEESAGLVGLVRELGASHSGSELSYDLPVPATPAELRACIGELRRSETRRAR